MSMKYLMVFLGGSVTVALAVSCAPVDLPDVPRTAATARGVSPEGTSPKTAHPDSLQERLEAAIKQVQQRELLTTNAFWTVFHGILGLGPEVELLNPETGKRVKALDYICAGGEIPGLTFEPKKYGLDVHTGPAFVGQGHQDQFVCEMAQWGMKKDQKFVVFGKDYTFEDFLRHSKMRVKLKAKPLQELSWTILIIGQFYGTDYTWTNSEGEKLHFEDLVRYEMSQRMDPKAAACGGTHRLFGLSWVLHQHLRRGGQKKGVWKELDNYLANYKNLARQFQNADGSFSTNYFYGPGNSTDKQQCLSTTGHIFEWLSLALTDEELKEDWVNRAANALSMIFMDIQDQPMEGGTLYHAVHGLIIYYARVYGVEKLGGHIPQVVLPPGCNLKGL